ncbi:ABC transporter permease [Nakamurella silvestris]|nr:ABC transporter permease [Nakamurella silvestris]
MLIGIVVLAAVVSFFWTPFSPVFTDVRNPAAPPGRGGHLLGTDRLGRDTLTWLMVGAQTTLKVGVIAVGIAAVVGTPIGILAGMTRRRWSEVIMRANDVLLAFPALLVALILAAKYGASITSSMVAIGIASVPGFVRVIRAGTIQVMGTDYVQAARIAGLRGPAIAVRHVLPNVFGLIIVQVSVAYAIAILAEAALSFLGLGAPPSVPSWGRMLNEAQSMLSVQPMIAVWPGLAIAVAVLGLNLLGDGLRDRFDPRMITRQVRP